jgi:hypothetical protein
MYFWYTVNGVEEAHRVRKFTHTSYTYLKDISRRELFTILKRDNKGDPDIPIETYDDVSSSMNYFNKLVENTVVTSSGNSSKEGFTRHWS